MNPKVLGVIKCTPELAKCPDSERIARAAELMYFDDVENNGTSVFDAKSTDLEPYDKRLDTYKKMMADGDQETVDYGVNLLSLCMWSGYLREEKRDEVLGEIENTIMKIKINLTSAGRRPDFDVFMTVEEAEAVLWA